MVEATGFLDNGVWYEQGWPNFSSWREDYEGI